MADKLGSDAEHINQKLLQCLKDTVEMEAWHCLGTADELKETPLRRLYGDNEGEDVVLVYDDEEDSFHAMDAVCSHEGGPLDLGDIEEVDGQRCLVCPWHRFEFKLDNGYSESSGLQQDVYPTMIVDDQLYIRTGELELSLTSRDLQQPNSAPVVASNVSREEVNDDSEGTLTHAAFHVLSAANPLDKIKLSDLLGENWKSGVITDVGSYPPPDEPLRSSDIFQVVAPGKEGKRGKGGSLASRIAILHAMANIELWAIDLSWDILCRFVPHYRLGGESLPREFTDDFVQVALDETKHFRLLCERLVQLGSHFGALAVHNGLWESAESTKDNLLARLAVVHMVHEARGLDIQPVQIGKFERQADTPSLSILNTVYTEEITHVAAGLRWFNYICQRSSPPLDPVEEFHRVVKKYFKGYLKPPFNADARRRAGMTPEWYEPLTKTAQRSHTQGSPA